MKPTPYRAPASRCLRRWAARVARAAGALALGTWSLAANATPPPGGTSGSLAAETARMPGDWRYVLLATGGTGGWYEPCG